MSLCGLRIPNGFIYLNCSSLCRSEICYFGATEQKCRIVLKDSILHSTQLLLILIKWGIHLYFRALLIWFYLRRYVSVQKTIAITWIVMWVSQESCLTGVLYLCCNICCLITRSFGSSNGIHSESADYLHGAEIPLWNWWKNAPVCLEPESSWPFPQKLAASSCPETDESVSRLTSQFFKIHPPSSHPHKGLSAGMFH